MKCVLRARGQLKRGFEVVALGEMCIQGVGVVEQGVSRWSCIASVCKFSAVLFVSVFFSTKLICFPINVSSPHLQCKDQISCQKCECLPGR